MAAFPYTRGASGPVKVVEVNFLPAKYLHRHIGKLFVTGRKVVLYNPAYAPDSPTYESFLYEADEVFSLVNVCKLLDTLANNVLSVQLLSSKDACIREFRIRDEDDFYSYFMAWEAYEVVREVRSKHEAEIQKNKAEGWPQSP